MSASPEVSVVVPAYNQAALLDRLLDSLERQIGAPAFEVIVVDDCSPDNTRAVVQSRINECKAFTLRYLRHEKNAGPGKARNTGLQAASGRVVAFTDTDCVADPHWLAELLKELAPEEGIAGVGGRVEPYGLDNLVGRFNLRYCSLEPVRSTRHPIPFLVTCNCCYLREALLAAGGFAEDIPNPGGEDTAAGIRMFKAGYRFSYAPFALIYHDFRDTFPKFLRTWWNYGFGNALVAHRMLDPCELNPEWRDQHVPNYWVVTPIRPTVTGLRSLLRDLRKFYRLCREYGDSHTQAFMWLGMRAAERLAYYQGWRAGIAAWRRETRTGAAQ